jgi:hypothetical protein
MIHHLKEGQESSPRQPFGDALLRIGARLGIAAEMAAVRQRGI